MNQFVRAGLMVVGLCAAPSLLAQQGEASGDAEHGAWLYHEHACYSCHGFNGQTGRMDFVGRESPFLTSEEVFKAYLRARENVAPLLPSTAMPNYPENSLDDSDVADIYAYIRTMELDAPDPDRIDTFQAIIRSAERPYQP